MLASAWLASQRTRQTKTRQQQQLPPSGRPTCKRRAHGEALHEPGAHPALLLATAGLGGHGVHLNSEYQASKALEMRASFGYIFSSKTIKQSVKFRKALAGMLLLGVGFNWQAGRGTHGRLATSTERLATSTRRLATSTGRLATSKKRYTSWQSSVAPNMSGASRLTFRKAPMAHRKPSWRRNIAFISPCELAASKSGDQVGVYHCTQRSAYISVTA